MNMLNIVYPHSICLKSSVVNLRYSRMGWGKFQDFISIKRQGNKLAIHERVFVQVLCVA